MEGGSHERNEWEEIGKTLANIRREDILMIVNHFKVIAGMMYRFAPRVASFLGERDEHLLK